MPDVEIMELPEVLMYGPWFTKVQNKKGWKLPIDTTMLAPRTSWDYDNFVRLIEASIAWFAGGGAVVEKTGVEMNGWPEVRITAPGYYAQIGS